MVKLNPDMIVRSTSGYNKKKRDEDTETFIKRLTHLYLEGKSLDDLGEELARCRSLSVLYLYDNSICAIPDLSQNYNLTYLYLQNNLITRMQNLNTLRRLTKLYLGGNKISVVEGLEHLQQIEELHLENQDLGPGEKLLFDPRSLVAIARTLKILNVSGNNLDSVRPLLIIADLQQFFCSHNKLTDMKEISSTLSKWYRLTHLDLNGNPLCTKPKYRDRVIVMSDSLVDLDGKAISDTSRQFLKNWKASKDAQRKKAEESMASSEIESNYQLSSLGEGDSRTQLNKISSYVMPGLPRKQFDEVLARSAANVPSSAVYTQPARRSNTAIVFPPNMRTNNSFEYIPGEFQTSQSAMPRSRTHAAQLPSTINF